MPMYVYGNLDDMFWIRRRAYDVHIIRYGTIYDVRFRVPQD